MNFFLISLPIFLGYAANNRADVLNHIGYVVDIQNEGTLSPLDFYPGLHIIQYAVETISGLSSTNSIILINGVFTILWTIGSMLLVEQLTDDKRTSYIAAAFTVPLWLLYYHTYILPSVLSLFLLPFLISLHIRRGKETGSAAVSLTIVEIIITLFLVYLHPSTTIFAIAIFIGLEFSARFSRRFKKEKSKIYDYLGIISITVIVLATWYLSFNLFTNQLARTIRWLLGEYDGSSAVGEAIGLLQIAKLPTINLVQILLNAFGAPLIIFSLAIVLISLVFILSRKTGKAIPTSHISFITVFILITITTLVVSLISSTERNPIRLLRVLVIISLVISSWWLWEVLYHPRGSSFWPYLPQKTRSVYKYLIFSFLLISTTLSRYNIYENPRNGLPNQRVTYSEMFGMKWFSTHRVTDSRTAAVLPDYVTRFDAFFSGIQGIREKWPNWWRKELWIPSGFYDQTWDCINQINLEKGTYLIISRNAVISSLRFPEAVRQLAHVYVASDWERLNKDKSINKIYDNGTFEIWMTNNYDGSCR
jgi:hypothetical protein